MKTIILIISLALTGKLSGEGMAFPSARPSVSPQKRFEITSTDVPAEKDGYALSLRDRRTGEQREFFHGSRTCDVLWSDDDSSVAVTEWAGSNLSQILVLKTGQKGSANALTVDTARRFMGRDESNGHCYWEALGWDAVGQLRVRAFGHTDARQSHQFEYEFLMDVNRKSATLVKQDNGMDSRAEDRIWDEKEKGIKQRPLPLPR